MLVYRITHKNFSRKLYAPGANGRWNEEGKEVIYCAESVHSAILPEAFNYAVNITHPECKKIKLIETTDLVPDERIEDILKKCSGK